jgi:hypothetical protein
LPNETDTVALAADLSPIKFDQLQLVGHAILTVGMAISTSTSIVPP